MLVGMRSCCEHKRACATTTHVPFWAQCCFRKNQAQAIAFINKINSHAKDGKQGKHLLFPYSHAYMWQALPSQHKTVQVGQRYKLCSEAVIMAA